MAAAVLHQLDLERDRLERAAEAAARDLARLAETIGRLETDDAREARLGEDAALALKRLEQEIAELATVLGGAPDEIERLAARADEAERRREQADAALEALATALAAARASGEALALRAREAEARLQQTRERLHASRREFALAPPRDDELTSSETEVLEAEAALVAASRALEIAEDETPGCGAARGGDERAITLGGRAAVRLGS